MGKYLGFLYADPSFTEGMARILDFGDTLTEYNRSLSPEQADAIAVTADWNAVIDDLATVMAQPDKDLGTAKFEALSDIR